MNISEYKLRKAQTEKYAIPN